MSQITKQKDRRSYIRFVLSLIFILSEKCVLFRQILEELFVGIHKLKVYKSLDELDAFDISLILLLLNATRKTASFQCLRGRAISWRYEQQMQACH